MKNKALSIFLVVMALGFILPYSTFAQSDKKLVREGNKDYKKGNFNEAEIYYRKALDKNPKKHSAQFNLGDALYEQEDYEKAAEVFASSNIASVSASDKSNTAYNLGNSFLKAGKLNESIAAYKQALKFNPENQDARYNLEYARQQQEQNEQDQNQDQNKDDQQDQNQDQNQDQKDQQQDQQDQEQEQQDQQNQEQNQDQNPSEQQQGQQNEQQSQKISKKDAERMLEALKNNEKKTLEKLKKEKKKNAKVIKSDKDW